jgi:hypothetical protein
LGAVTHGSDTCCYPTVNRDSVSEFYNFFNLDLAIAYGLN